MVSRLLFLATLAISATFAMDRFSTKHVFNKGDAVVNGIHSSDVIYSVTGYYPAANGDTVYVVVDEDGKETCFSEPVLRRWDRGGTGN